MPNRYTQPIDPSRTSSLQTLGQPADPAHYRTSPEVIRARVSDPAMVAKLRAHGLTDAEIQALPEVYTQWINQVGLKKNWLDRHPTVAKLLMVAPVAGLGGVLAAPYLASAVGGTAASTSAPVTAGTVGPAATTAAGVLPATATVPLSTGTVAGLSASGAVPAAFAGGGAAAGGAAASELAPLAARQTVPNATTTIPGLSSGTSAKSIFSNLGGGGLTNWLTNPTVLSAGLGTAGQLIGAGIQSSGISKAAEIEAAVQREALAYEKQRDQYLQNLEAQRYGELNQRLQPYISTGQNASDRMAQILGLPAPAPYTPSVPIPTNPNAAPPGTYENFRPRPPDVPPSGYAVPRPGGSATNPVPSRLVTMVAPDGTQKQVPQEQVAHFTALGAQVIG